MITFGTHSLRRLLGVFGGLSVNSYFKILLPLPEGIIGFAVVYILLITIACINFAYAVSCRRVFPFLALISLAIVFIYFIGFKSETIKDTLLTKIYLLVIFGIIIMLLFSAYIFVCKQDDVSLTNGQATLWDTNTVKLADEICFDCDTNEEKVQTFHRQIKF